MTITINGSGTVTGANTLTNTNTVTSAAATALTLQSAGTTAVTIDTSQNVGIGTTNPSAGKLSIVAAVASTAFYAGSSTQGVYISNSTGNDVVYNSSGNNVGAHVWQTGNTERARIDSIGNFLVGKTVDGTTAGFSFTPAWWAANVGQALVSGNSTSNSQQAFSVYTTASSQYQFHVSYGGNVYARSTSITGLSDISEKENIKDLETGIGTVLALKPRRFDWKNGSGTNIAGFIAQEVELILPDLVESYRVSEDETKLGLKMGDMIPTLVKAMQEQQALITSLTTRLTALENK